MTPGDADRGGNGPPRCPFSLMAEDYPAADPYPTYRSFRDDIPVFFTDDMDGYWVVTRYDDVFEAGRDWQRFSSAQGVLPRVPAASGTASGRVDLAQERERAKYKGIPLATDPPDHALYRRVISKHLGKPAVAQMRGSIRRRIHDLLDGAPCADEGPAHTFDIAEVLTGPLPGLVLAEVAGLPEKDHDQFQRWSSEGQFEELHRYIESFMDSDCDQGIFGTLRTGRVGDRPLTRAEQVSYGRLLLVAGHETTSAGLAFMIYHLCTMPGLQDRLRQDPSLRPGAIEEFLRYEPPVQGLWRTVAEPTELQGCSMAPGDQLLLLWGSANRDERHFRDPDRFDERRDPNDHIVFGSGRHRCIGAELARTEMREVLDVLLERFGHIRLADGGRMTTRMSPAGGVRGLGHLDVTVHDTQRHRVQR